MNKRDDAADAEEWWIQLPNSVHSGGVRSSLRSIHGNGDPQGCKEELSERDRFDRREKSIRVRIREGAEAEQDDEGEALDANRVGERLERFILVDERREESDELAHDDEAQDPADEATRGRDKESRHDPEREADQSLSGAITDQGRDARHLRKGRSTRENTRGCGRETEMYDDDGEQDEPAVS